VTFSGQDGRVLQTTTGTTARYDVTAADAYVRVTVHGPAFDLYLNPLIRTGGGPPHSPHASIDPWWTAVRRTVLLVLCVAFAIAGVRGRDYRGFARTLS
jgi:hypothetical protein